MLYSFVVYIDVVVSEDIFIYKLKHTFVFLGDIYSYFSTVIVCKTTFKHFSYRLPSSFNHFSIEIHGRFNIVAVFVRNFHLLVFVVFLKIVV